MGSSTVIGVGSGRSLFKFKSLVRDVQGPRLWRRWRMREGQAAEGEEEGWTRRRGE